MLKLLFVAEVSSPSGGHQQRYLQLLARAGVQIHLLEQSPPLGGSDLPVVTHLKWPKCGRRTMNKILGPSVGNRLADWTLHRQLKSAWQRSRAEVCHVIWIDERAWHCEVAGLHPLVLTSLGSDLNSTRLQDHDPQLLQQRAEAIAGCDLFIADSEDMIAIASNIAGRDLKSLLLPIGINTQMFRPGYERQASEWRSLLGIEESATVILSARLVGQNYRHETIMKAFCKAVQKGGIDAYIIFRTYNSDKADIEQILAIASQQGMLERVRMIGEVPYQHLPIVYSMADFAVNFPAMDAFPVTFLECCACELPILSNRLPAYSSNGMAKYLTFVDEDNEYGLSRQLVSMCNGGIDLSLMREARAHVVRHFDESAFIAELVSAYGRLVTKETSGPIE